MIKSFFIVLFCMFTLSGCSNFEDKPFLSPDITFENFKTLAVNAGKVEVINEYKMPMKAPNVEHLFSNPIYNAVEDFINKKVVPVGEDNILKVIISDASVVKQELPVDETFWGNFMNEPSERLQANLVIRFEMVDANAPDIIIGHADIVAKRNKTLMEWGSVSDRDKVYFTLTENLIADLNTGMAEVINKSFEQ